MVFSKITENIKIMLSDTNKNYEENYNKKSIDILLNQGKLHKSKKIIKINNFNKKKYIIENNSNFEKGDRKLYKSVEKSKEFLEKIKNKYDKNTSKWATDSKIFMDNYNLLVNEVNICKKKCLKQISGNETNRHKKIEACSYGCRLREPELQHMQNNPGSNCNNVKCLNRNVMPGYESTVTEEQRKNCSTCGGGVGGSPIIRSLGTNLNKNITSCNNIDEAYGESGTKFKEACMKGYNYFQNKVESGGNYNLNKKLYNFTVEYNTLINSTQELNSNAGSLEKATNDLRQKRKKIMTNLSKIEGMSNIEGFINSELLEKYNQVYAKKNLEKTTSPTQKAQLEDIELKLKSQQLQLYIWSSLAILTMLLVIQKIRQ